VVNRIRHGREYGVLRYEYTRYFFSNASSDIRELFMKACVSIGVDCRPTTERNVSVARRKSVLILDSFIGPKA
jgi:hypothetical protein